MKKVTLFFILVFGLCHAIAQTQIITGTVTSAEDKEPIPGVSVIVKGTSLGTVTDIEGKYELKVPSSAKTLIFRFIGLKTKEVVINGAVNNATLEQETVGVDEVVVTALGITREKKALGYSVQEIKSDELNQVGPSNLTSALSGKIAGVQVNQFGGSVGASSRISIRGNSSFAEDQQPLIVVDGVPITNDTQRSGDNYYKGVDYGSGLNDINPDDIESMTILKGASAALYGMRAGRGVILITTKSGKNAPKGVTITYDGSMSFSQAANIPKLQNKYGQGQNGDEYHWKQNTEELNYQDYSTTHGFNYNGVNNGYDESWGPRLDIGLKLPQFDSPRANDGTYEATEWVSHPNNVKNFFQTGLVMNHMLSIRSQSEKSTVRASLSYRDEKGTIPNTDQKRYSAQFNTNTKLNEKLSFEMMGNFTHTESDNLVGQGYGDNNPINSLVCWSGRQINMKSLKNNWNQKDATGNYTYYNWINTYHMNPYFTVNKNTNSMKRNRLFGKASLSYQPIKHLKFEARAGYDYYDLETFERYYYHWNNPKGSFEQQNTNNANLELDFIGSYNNNFGDFNISILAGANYRNQLWEWNKIGAKELTVLGVYTVSNKSGDADTDMDHSHIRSNSVYGSASVGWKNQLYLDLSARNDWSSTISENFFYPSASLSWIPTESIGALKDNETLSFLKLRLGISQVGAATSAYRTKAYYYAESSSFNGVPLMYKSTVYPNADLRPEMMTSYEGGFEIGLFNDRLHADFACYKKITKDQIMKVPVARTSGKSSLMINAGKIRNKGIELQLTGDILRNRNGLNWTSTFTFSKDRSKILELSSDYPSVTSIRLGWTWGIPNQAIKGEKWGVLVADGYDRVTQDDINKGIVDDGIPVGAIKVKNTGLIKSKKDVHIANVCPDFLTGLRNDFTYKNFGFGFFLDARIGGEIWSQSMSHSYAAGTAKITAKNDIRERAILPGKDIMTDDVFVMQDKNGKWIADNIKVAAQYWYKSGGTNEMYVFDGSFLKLREAYISYSIPSSVLKKTKAITKATISLVGSNLALLMVDDSNTLRLDPETGGVSSDSRGVGYEQASVPNSRTFGFKLNLTF